ncbi:benzoate 4-monooxygenase cytochrome P450 [Metarhizium brunneum]
MTKLETGCEEIENECHAELSEERRQYRAARHGMTKRDSLPQIDDNDPLRWPKSKKLLNLALVAFHGFMATFSAAAIMSAFVDIAADLHVSVQKASYLTSLFIVILGAAPLFWRPLSQAYGRRPIFLISLVGSMLGNVGCAVTKSYGTMALCRAITAFFISPAASIGSAVVSEMFLKEERAQYMGVWTAMVTLGVPLAPLLFGFVVLRVGYRWVYWILAITNGVQFVLYLLFGPESRFIRNENASKSLIHASWKRQHLTFRRIDPSPITIWDFLHPLTLAAHLRVALPAILYSMVFLWGSVMTTFEIPQIFPERFHLDTQQVGLQFISVLVGTIIGEQLGGTLSDRWMLLGRQKTGKQQRPEFRLWLSYIGHLLTIAGTVVFFVQLSKAQTWNVTPLLGAGISAGGNQIVTTIMITYAVDCYPHDAAAVGVFILLVRQTWGFIGPFWIPQMVDVLGLAMSSVLATAMIVVVSIIPTVILQLLGKNSIEEW